MTDSLVSLEDIQAEARDLLTGTLDGTDLDPPTAALIQLAVHASVCTLDVDGIDTGIRHALSAGATPAQIHETLVLVSALGVHTLMEGSGRLAAILRERGDPGVDTPLDDERTTLRARLRDGDRYWDDFEQEVPGFLDALLRLSPEAYEAFFTYCAVPWRTHQIPARTKELMAMATDATPTHRYLPGVRLHLLGAVRLGAGRTAVLHALDIAATAPPHRGVPRHEAE